MGRRSRQRDAERAAAPPAAAPAPPPAAPRTPRRHARLDEAPKAPWHPVPLVELAILAGLILVVAGFVSGGESGGILVAGGIVLVSVAALELAVREHVTGYRSHTGLLAGVCGVAVAAGLRFAGVNQIVVLAIAVVVGIFAFVALRGAFQRKAGGLTWRA
jgi:hypothetical protein